MEPRKYAVKYYTYDHMSKGASTPEHSIIEAFDAADAHTQLLVDMQHCDVQVQGIRQFVHTRCRICAEEIESGIMEEYGKGFAHQKCVWKKNAEAKTPHASAAQ